VDLAGLLHQGLALPSSAAAKAKPDGIAILAVAVMAVRRQVQQPMAGQARIHGQRKPTRQAAHRQAALTAAMAALLALVPLAL
jgi:hypothetical protein